MRLFRTCQQRQVEKYRIGWQRGLVGLPAGRLGVDPGVAVDRRVDAHRLNRLHRGQLAAIHPVAFAGNLDHRSGPDLAARGWQAQPQAVTGQTRLDQPTLGHGRSLGPC